MGIFSIVRLRSIRNADYAVEDLELILQTDIFISIDLSDGCWQATFSAAGRAACAVAACAVAAARAPRRLRGRLLFYSSRNVNAFDVTRMV